MLIFFYLLKIKKNKKKNKMFKYYLSNKRKKENINIKIFYNTKKILKKENNLDI